MSTTVYEMIRSSMPATVPFAKHTGVELLEVGAGTAKAQLDQTPETTNHMGSIHAGALFTLAETAAGGAVAGGFAPFMLNMKAFPIGMTIKLSKPAKQTASAVAEVASDIGDLRDNLRDNKSVSFNTNVDLLSKDGETIGTMGSEWLVSLRQ